MSETIKKPASSEGIIQMLGVNKWYGQFHVLKDINLNVQPGERIVTLEVHGKPWSTEQLAVELDRWRLDSRTVNFMVGGPEGLAPEVCARAEQRWSLSPLTLPHPLVRILIGEQLYRAWTVLSGHPYHK